MTAIAATTSWPAGRDRRVVAAAAALTLVGVPAGMALTGGNVDSIMTASLAGTLALLALLLGRWPLTVTILSVLTVAGLRGSFLVEAGWVWPATAAFAALALAGRLRAAIAVAGVMLAYGWSWDGFVNTDHGVSWAMAHIGAEALWIALVLAGATAYRDNRRWRLEVAARLEQDEHERALDARRRRAEERVGIARDLHDVVSHTLAVVGVHLNVAMDAFDSDRQEARDALRLAQEVRGQAMSDLRALVEVLRDGGTRIEPAGGLDGLEQLAEQVREAGLAVAVDEVGDRRDVPAPVATAVYRVVQESLTNTVRHAGATRVDVRLVYADNEVSIEVADNGRGGEPAGTGHGIPGMRERVAALGGALTAGGGQAGFTVRAVIPVSGRP